MKIKLRKADYDSVCEKKRVPRKKPLKPSLFFRTLVRAVSASDLKATDFTYSEEGMERLGPNEPCLILMNHSSFIDLKMCFHIFRKRPMNIVCTSDGFVGKEWLMRHLGCIPTQKFVTDVNLLRDMKYAIEKLHSSVLMFPEASYSFDGTATPLPESVGKCLKMLGVPVVMVRSYGAFTRDPLYNNLQLRKVKVSAKVTYLLSPEDIKEKSAGELNAILKEQFTFDHFKWQQEEQIAVTEDFRADCLNRVLYKCPHCLTEGKMLGKGIGITCGHCGASYELTEYGALKRIENWEGVPAPVQDSLEAAFTHIPDWYRWERQEVHKELSEGTYRLNLPVEIFMLTDFSCVYDVGEGRLRHDTNGFTLTGCDGRLCYRQSPESSYSLYADYYWYEIGDMVCVGTPEKLYYCFPKMEGDVVAKARLAAEELYKLTMSRKKACK